MEQLTVTPEEAGVLIGGLERYRDTLTGYEYGDPAEAESARREYRLIQPLIDRLLPIYRQITDS